jgi:hypothetical protein
MFVAMHAFNSGAKWGRERERNLQILSDLPLLMAYAANTVHRTGIKINAIQHLSIYGLTKCNVLRLALVMI